MQRVKRATAVVALPTAPAGGTPGYFSHPDPVGGIPATVPGFEWFNSVQEELCAIVAAAGITLAVSDVTQVLQALPGALASRPEMANSLVSAGGYQKLPGGLIIQWGLGTSGSGGNTTITYPIAFPNQTLRVIASSPVGNVLNGVSGGSATNFTVGSYLANTGAAQVGVAIPWIAIGN